MPYLVLKRHFGAFKRLSKAAKNFNLALGVKSKKWRFQSPEPILSNIYSTVVQKMHFLKLFSFICSFTILFGGIQN
jgi:hypothetical protein